MPDPESAFKPQSSVADTAAAAAVKSVGKPVGSVRGSLAAELSRRWTHLLDASRVPEGGLVRVERGWCQWCRSLEGSARFWGAAI